MWLPSVFRPTYEPIPEDAEFCPEASGSSSEKLLGNDAQPAGPFIKWPLPWMLIALFFASSTIILLLRPVPEYILEQYPSFEKGFPTDFEDARSVISIEQRVFTGGLAVNTTTGRIDRVINPSAPQYFGSPGPDIDASWEKLLAEHWIDINVDEDKLWTSLQRELNAGTHHVVIDMYHSLHCLNTVRKTLDHEYYHDDPDVNIATQSSFSRGLPGSFSSSERTYLDHCLDQMRQAISCGGDLTPVSFVTTSQGAGFALGGVGGFGGVGQAHTCRRIEPFKKHLDER